MKIFQGLSLNCTMRNEEGNPSTSLVFKDGRGINNIETKENTQ